MMTYLVEQDFEPVLIDDETYVPSGAVKSSAVLEMHLMNKFQMETFVLNAVTVCHLLQNSVLNVEQHNKKIIF